MKGESVTDIDAVITQLEQQREAIDKALAALRDIGGSRGASAPQSSSPAQGGIRKRVLTPAGRRRIAEAARRRWAEKRASEGRQAKAVKKGPAPRKNQITAAGRKRLAEAMRRRWALKRASSGQGAAAKATGKRAPRKAGKKRASKQVSA